MSARLDYRLVNFVLACVGGAIAVYIAVAVPPPHAPGTPVLVPLDHTASPVVYVTGAVKSPGLYQLAPEARLYAAIQAAGGFTSAAQPEGLNMARRLKDEEMVTVPSISAPAPAAQATAPAGDVEQMAALPGVSRKVAERIAEYRREHGTLTAEDLRHIPGCKRRWKHLAEVLGLTQEKADPDVNSQ
ncbi:MAG TPA: SLBB domain-containing protein [Candidatus Xenobia bacterium]|jgi:competence protein ComEA